MNSHTDQIHSKAKKCIIAGGGISGLTVATLLIEKGYDVTIIEGIDEIGGKAKSKRMTDGNPTEHSLRIYGRTYACLLNIIDKIPYQSGKVIDNLVLPKRVLLSKLNKTDRVIHSSKNVNLSKKRWSKFRQWIYWKAFKNIHGTANIFLKSLVLLVKFKALGISFKESFKFLCSHIKLHFSSEKELTSLGDMSYEDYINFNQYSDKFVQYITSVMKIIVVTRTYANARSIAFSMMLAFFRWGLPAKGYEHLPNTHLFMNGPTSEKFLNPWRKSLEKSGVKFILKNHVVDFQVDTGTQKIEAFILANGERVTGDLYVLGVPFFEYKKFYERTNLNQILNQPLPKNIKCEWSNGMQFFLNKLPQDLRFQPGSASYYLDTPWAFCSLVQGTPFWANVQSFASNTKYIFSCTYTSRYVKGIVTGKTFTECTREEIFEEAVAQCGLDKEFILDWSLDWEIDFMDQEKYDKVKSTLRAHDAIPNGKNSVIINYSPLAVDMPGSDRDILKNKIANNLFVCGEFTKTSYPLATMERACESGYRAVAAILKEENISFDIPLNVVFPFKVHLPEC